MKDEQEFGFAYPFLNHRFDSIKSRTHEIFGVREFRFGGSLNCFQPATRGRTFEAFSGDIVAVFNSVRLFLQKPARGKDALVSAPRLLCGLLQQSYNFENRCIFARANIERVTAKRKNGGIIRRF